MALRGCSACHQEDDGPRDVIWNSDKLFHMDCHALMGCESCLETVRAAGGKKDSELRAFIQEGGK
jgi:hypothetical protein